jgi:hypothetical protein
VTKIQLSGDIKTLKTLSELFDGKQMQININCDNSHKDVYYLSGDLKLNIDVNNIHLSIPMISNIIDEINFICNFVLRNYTPITFAHIWIDNACYIFIKDTVRLEDEIQGDNKYEYEKELIGKILQKKDGDRVLIKILQSLFEYDLDWVNLYRILELIESQKIDIVKRKWLSNEEYKLFKWTANSPDVLGIKSRHGKQTHKSPAKPMTIFQARYLIKNLIIKYITE